MQGGRGNVGRMTSQDPQITRASYVLDHVALGVADFDAAARYLSARLGGQPAAGGPGVGYRGGQWAFAAAERIELIQPDGPPGGFLHRFLERHGPGVHHVTFKVPEFAAACARARRYGYELVGVDDSNPGWKEAFLHPKQAQGIVVQLAEAHPELDEGWGPDWKHPEPPRDPPPPARVEALELVALEEARARRQWEEMLGGRCERQAGRLVFRWSDSPLAVAVRVEPSGREGPIALWIAGAAAATLPERPPELGVRLIATPGGEAAT